MLDIPVEEDNFTRSHGIDWAVFGGVTAVIAVGFLVWGGFVSTDTLATASSSALAWVMDKTGWLFVLTSTGFVVFVLYLALAPPTARSRWAVTTRRPSSTASPGSR